MFLVISGFVTGAAAAGDGVALSFFPGSVDESATAESDFLKTKMI